MLYKVKIRLACELLIQRETIGKVGPHMAVKALSINISDSIIKMAEVSYSNGNTTVYKALSIPTPEGAYEDGYLRKVNDIARAISMARVNAGIKTKNVIFSIYSQRIANREVMIPFVKENQIKDIVNTNAAEYFPVNIEEYIISYVDKGVEETQEGKKRRLLVFAAPEMMVISYYELARALEMQLQGIDFVGNSSSAIMEKQINKAGSVVIHMEREYSIITVYSNCQLRIQRFIPYGKDLVIEAMRENFPEMDDAKIVEVLESERLIHNSFDDGDAITGSLRYFVSNINRVVDYYNTRFPEEPIEAAYLTGECVTLLGIENLCANEFKFSIMQLMDYAGVIEDKGANLSPRSIGKYTICLGAIIKPCGFVTREVVEKEKKANTVKYFRLVFLVSVLIAVVLVVVPLPAYLDAKQKVQDTKDSIKRLEHVQDDVDEYFAQKDAYTDLMVFAAMSANNNSTLSKFVKDLETNIPSDISFKTMSISEGLVNASGEASSKDSVAKLSVELKKLQYVTNTRIISMSEAVNEEGIVTVSFSISFDIAPYVAPETTEGETTADSEEATTEAADDVTEAATDETTEATTDGATEAATDEITTKGEGV